MNALLKLKNPKILRALALRSALALAIGLGIHFFVSFPALEYVTYDWRMKLNPIEEFSNRIQNVVINQNDLAKFSGEPKAQDYTIAIKQLLNKNPSHIIFIFDPSKIKGTDSNRKKLAKILEQKNIYYALNSLPTKDISVQREAPFDKLSVIMGPKTSDTVTFAKDKVTRRAIVSYSNTPSLHVLIAKSILPNFNAHQLRGTYKFYRTTQLLINFLPTGSYKPISFSQIEKTSPTTFTNKIVFIGKDNLESNQYISTPYSKSPTAMSNLELHANIMDTILLNKAPTPVSPFLDGLLILLLSLLIVFAVMRLKPIRSLQVMLLNLVGFILFSYLLFITFGWVIAVLQPLLAIFICYYLFIPYRLILENQRYWEYQQKNKILIQVEELKSNFLKMMSHDTKTPLARIQGMIKIISSDKNELSSSQKDALQRIHQSSDELIDFISSVLNLSRIESKDVKLQAKSHDINKVLKSAVDKCRYLAQQKNITIELKTEPLFSIKIDKDLIKQVFVNLIENAIKYSKEHSIVKISSYEGEQSDVIITVSDEGMGIAKEDLAHIFNKFFRSPQAEASKTKGTGLGLYLSKYFIYLHKGELTVESSLNEGSTFKARLPT